MALYDVESSRQRALSDLGNGGDPDDLLKKYSKEMGEITKHFGTESDIPLNHRYWELRNQYQLVASKKKG